MNYEMAGLLKEALLKKCPSRCPVKRRAPRGEKLYIVPLRLRRLLYLWVRLSRQVNPRRRGVESFWETERADSLEFLLEDSIRTSGKHGRVNVQFYRNWRYSVALLQRPTKSRKK